MNDLADVDQTVEAVLDVDEYGGRRDLQRLLALRRFDRGEARRMAPISAPAEDAP